MNGVVGYDLALDSEQIIVNSGDFDLPSEWETLAGLGITPSGSVAACTDINWGTACLGYDPVTGVAGREGFGVGHLLHDEDLSSIGGLYNLHFTSRPDGRVFVAAAEVGWEDNWEPLPEQFGVWAIGSRGPTLIDGKAFSPGSYVRELQPVVIPEPSTALLVGLGLAGLGVRRRAA